MEKHEKILKASIDLNDEKLYALIKTSNYSFMNIKPEKSIINITSNMLNKYDIDFSLYNVSNLVQKELDKISGEFQLACNEFLCSDYNIYFDNNIIIEDEDYRGEFQIGEVKNINDFKLEVKSSFVNIFKTNP